MDELRARPYRLSRYNIFFERPEGRFLWNTLSDALIRMDDNAISWLDDYDGVDDGSDYFSVLLANGCVVPAGYDELGQVLVDEKATMLDRDLKVLHFTIAPSLGCNYACPYCFELGARENLAMSAEVRRDTVKYILNVASRCHDLKKLGVTWFGGEPLLQVSAIEEMSNALISWCSEHGITYSAGIVTNGRYLTYSNARKLVDCRVSYVQLSMDGPLERHMASKHASAKDFWETVANIEKSADVIPITVRINVTDSLDDAIALCDLLLCERGLDGKIKVYVAHVRDYDPAALGGEKDSHRRFLRLQGDFLKLFGDEGPYDPGSFSYVVPRRRRTTCLTVCGDNACVGPKGELYRCEHQFGRMEYKVGDVWNGRGFVPHDLSYLSHRHFDECLSCDVFPVCLGGCINDASNGAPVLACEEFRERLIDFLMLDYRKR